jgi:hypothetical protein
MEAILGFFALWGIGFWILATIASIIFIAGCEKDELGLSIFATIVLAVIYYKSIILVFSNPVMLMICVVGWLIAGVINSCWRLRNMARDVVEKYNETRSGNPEYELQLSRNKSRITNWIIYWPWSLFWNFTRDFFNTLYKAMSGIYQRIIDKALDGIVNKKK